MVKLPGKATYNRIKNLLKIFRLFKDQRVPLVSKMFFVLGLLYFFSPIDFIPDILLIPGLFDDLLIVPALIYVGFYFIPEKIKEEYRI